MTLPVLQSFEKNLTRVVFVINQISHGLNGISAPVAVASLPAATTSTGQRAMVNNATATTFNSVVAGGGANTVPVFSDGTNWRIG